MLKDIQMIQPIVKMRPKPHYFVVTKLNAISNVSMNCFLSNVSNKGRYTTSILLSISKFNFALAQTTSN